MAYKITRDKADAVFSQFIRLRDKECRRCHSPVRFNDKGMPISHQASHFIGRGKEGTRFDEENCDTLCGACHMFFTSHPIEHYEWQLERKGEDTIQRLKLQSHTYHKKDRKLAHIYWTERLKELK